jgi:hypothetical protein
MPAPTWAGTWRWRLQCGEIVQIKQDRMIPIFRCVVVETLVAQYCGMFSAAGVTRYIRFQELKPLEA